MFLHRSLYLALILWFSLGVGRLHAQMPNDFSVILHEETINKVFLALGDIKGTSQYEVLLIKGDYTWTVINPRIHLKPDSSDFTCNVKVEVGPFDYQTEVVGTVRIAYDNKKNEISIQITRAVFELYTKVFGKKIHIKDIHLEEYFKDPFLFEGPRTLSTEMEFTLPDSTKKVIYVQPSNCAMRVVAKAIITECEIMASDKPFLPTPKTATQPPRADKPKPLSPTNTAGSKK